MRILYLMKSLIAVKPEVHKQLALYKYKNSCGTYSEAINKLLSEVPA